MKFASLSRRLFLASLATLPLLPKPAQADVAKLIASDEKIPVPMLGFLDESGSLKHLSDYQGRPVLLNIWATWCAPCIEEMPTLAKLQRQWPELAVLPVSMDLGGAKSVRSFFDRNAIEDLPVLVESERSIRKNIKPKGLPLTLLINSKGQEVARALGKLEWDSAEVVGRLRQLLGA